MYKIEQRAGYILQQLTGAATVAEVKKFTAEAIALVRRPGNRVRVLNDYRDAFLREDGVQELLKEWVAGNEPYIEKAAVLGVTGIKKLLYRLVTGGKQHIRLFDDERSALAWLLAD
jgi:hypothetical protein